MLQERPSERRHYAPPGSPSDSPYLAVCQGPLPCRPAFRNFRRPGLGPTAASLPQAGPSTIYGLGRRWF